jgi:hypothetical protein
MGEPHVTKVVHRSMIDFLMFFHGSKSKKRFVSRTVFLSTRIFSIRQGSAPPIRRMLLQSAQSCVWGSSFLPVGGSWTSRLRRGVDRRPQKSDATQFHWRKWILDISKHWAYLGIMFISPWGLKYHGDYSFKQPLACTLKGLIFTFFLRLRSQPLLVKFTDYPCLSHLSHVMVSRYLLGVCWRWLVAFTMGSAPFGSIQRIYTEPYLFEPSSALSILKASLSRSKLSQPRPRATWNSSTAWRGRA